MSCRWCAHNFIFTLFRATIQLIALTTSTTQHHTHTFLCVQKRTIEPVRSGPGFVGVSEAGAYTHIYIYILATGKEEFSRVERGHIDCLLSEPLLGQLVPIDCAQINQQFPDALGQFDEVQQQQSTHCGRSAINKLPTLQYV